MGKAWALDWSEPGWLSTQVLTAASRANRLTSDRTGSGAGAHIRRSRHIGVAARRSTKWRSRRRGPGSAAVAPGAAPLGLRRGGLAQVAVERLIEVEVVTPA